MNLFEKQALFFSYGETKIGQGRENAKIFIHENPKISQQIEKQVREKVTILANGGATIQSAPELPEEE